MGANLRKSGFIEKRGEGFDDRSDRFGVVPRKDRFRGAGPPVEDVFGEEEAGAVVFTLFQEVGEEFERNSEMVFREVQVVRKREAFFPIGGAGREGLRLAVKLSGVRPGALGERERHARYPVKELRLALRDGVGVEFLDRDGFRGVGRGEHRLAMVKKRQPDGSVKEEIDDDLRQTLILKLLEAIPQFPIEKE